MKTVFSNEDVKHSHSCCSINCFLDSPEKHVKIFYFETKEVMYFADSLDAAAKLWIKGGAKKIICVGSIG